MRPLSISRLAYLSMIRNVRRGLVSRSAIIKSLDSITWKRTSEIAQQVEVTAHTILYHLRNLEREKIVERDAESKGWRLGPYEQVELTQFLTSAKAKQRKKK